MLEDHPSGRNDATDEQRGVATEGPSAGLQASTSLGNGEAGGVTASAHPPNPPTCRPESTGEAAAKQDEFGHDQAEAGPPPHEDVSDFDAEPDGGMVTPPRLPGRRRGQRLLKKAEAPAPPLTAEQRLLLLDTWQRSKLPASDFAAMVGLTKHTLYGWKKKFDAEGPAGLVDKPRGGPRGSRVHEVTKRTILMLKQANPGWGCQRISDMLVRGPGLPASASAVGRVLV